MNAKYILFFSIISLSITATVLYKLDYEPQNAFDLTPSDDCVYGFYKTNEAGVVGGKRRASCTRNEQRRIWENVEDLPFDEYQSRGRLIGSFERDGIKYAVIDRY